MKKQKLTPWFDGKSVNPVRPGVYECDWQDAKMPLDNGIWFNRWTGKNWVCGRDTVDSAKEAPNKEVTRQRPSRWRGVSGPK